MFDCGDVRLAPKPWGGDCRLDATRGEQVCAALRAAPRCELLCVVAAAMSCAVEQASSAQLPAGWTKANSYFISLSPPKIKLRTVLKKCFKAGCHMYVRERE